MTNHTGESHLIDWTPELVNAIEKGDRDRVGMALQKGASVKAQRVLPLACEKGDAEIVRTLLSHGASVTVKDGKSFRNALTYGHGEILELLLGAGTSTINEKVIMWAVQSRNPEMVRVVLQHGVELRPFANAMVHARKMKEDGNGTQLEIAALMLKHRHTVIMPERWETIEFSIGHTAKGAFDQFERYLKTKRDTLLAEPPKKREELLFAGDTPRWRMRCFAAAGYLPELFDAKHWAGEEARAYRIYTHARNALPHERHVFNEIDTTAFLPAPPALPGFASRVTPPIGTRTR